MGNKSTKDQSSISSSNKIKKKCTDKEDNPHQFIINLNRKQKLRGINNSNIINDQRRVVFISLLGLYSTWEQVPTSMLYTSIFLLPIKLEWIYDPIKCEEEIKQSIMCQINIFNDKATFVDLLKWKDSQKLLFCMLDHDKYDSNEEKDIEYKQNESELTNQLVSPFWKYFSKRLTTLYNPITNSEFQPLKFNAKWWENSYIKLFKSHYNVQPSTILSELYFVSTKFKPIQEILYQSNPGSINPIITYDILTPQCDNNMWDNFFSDNNTNNTTFINMNKNTKQIDNYGFIAFTNGCVNDIDSDTNAISENEGTWMISTDYNEYNMED